MALALAALAAAGIAVIAAGVSPVTAAPGAQAAALQVTLKGRVLSGDLPLASTPVTLYRTPPGGSGAAVALGWSQTRADGWFGISYPPQRDSDALLYLIAGRGVAVRLAAVLGDPPVPGTVVVNERTTVAAGFALAQFITGRDIAGKFPGPQNAAAMAANLADVRAGGLSSVLQTAPNGTQTSTLQTFNSVANMLVPCARSASRCGPLFALATPPRGPAPRGTLAAVADIARNPGRNAAGLFALARSGPAPYQPALGPSGRPDAWILALRFDGNGTTIDGPGNIAIDARGNVWVNNNLDFSANPRAVVCGSRLLFKFTPAGRFVPGSPYSGGGLNGAGYGITVDTRGNIWVSNFGFASQACADQPPHLSVSEFTPGGQPQSPDQTAASPGGFTAGGIYWPQGIVSDRQGNIWIANCGNNTVTRYAHGNPKAFSSIGLGIQKPFDIAFNRRGQAFVTGNGDNAVAMLNPDGTSARPPITGGGMSRPLGIAADSYGNMWISNSAVAGPSCPGAPPAKPTFKPSLTLINSDGTAVMGPFTGGGLTIPFGIAVDGHDNVWVANFAGQRVSEFCGSEPVKCPLGTRTGQPISPSAGYGFDGLARVTALQIDPSGNVWICNNWKNFPLPRKNPGGHQLVVYVGVAGPLQTPLIGPPVPLPT
jgi:sugar lactone lactonase YvrE